MDQGAFSAENILNLSCCATWEHYIYSESSGSPFIVFAVQLKVELATCSASLIMQYHKLHKNLSWYSDNDLLNLVYSMMHVKSLHASGSID